MSARRGRLGARFARFVVVVVGMPASRREITERPVSIWRRHSANRADLRIPVLKRLVRVPARVLPLALPALVAAIVAAGFGGSTRAAADPVSVFPAAGTPVASATTQISFRGAPPRALGTVTVRASATGVHTGRLLAHSDGDGASFVPDRPFRAGERVTVTAGAPLVGGAGGSVTFSIARTPGRERIHYTPDPGGDPRGAQHFRSRPGLSPPTLQVTTLANGVAPGSIFTAVKAGPGQDGPMITDGNGRLVWFRRVPHGTSAFDFRAQQYDGRPVLTWWQGRVFNGEGHGVGLIFDSSYRQI